MPKFCASANVNNDWTLNEGTEGPESGTEGEAIYFENEIFDCLSFPLKGTEGTEGKGFVPPRFNVGGLETLGLSGNIVRAPASTLRYISFRPDEVYVQPSITYNPWCTSM